MMDNPMRAASVGRGGAAEEARYSMHEPPGRRQPHGNPTGNGMVDETNHYGMQPPGRQRLNSSTSAGGALEEERYSGYEPPLSTGSTASATAGSEIVYAVPVEDAADGARVPNPLYQPADGPSADNRTLARLPNPIYQPADGPSANNRTLVRLPNPIYQPASNSMYDDGDAAVVARVPNQSSLYYDADPVPSEAMAAASVLNAAASTTAMTSAPAGAAGKCARPSPSGGVCKKAAVPGTLFCKGHTCPAPGCTAGKSTKMVTCPSHVHVNIDGPRPAVGEVFHDAFGGAADNDNDHNDGAAQSLSPAAPHTNGAIYAVSAKQSARTAAVADGEGDANVMNC